MAGRIEPIMHTINVCRKKEKSKNSCLQCLSLHHSHTQYVIVPTALNRTKNDKWNRCRIHARYTYKWAQSCIHITCCIGMKYLGPFSLSSATTLRGHSIIDLHSKRDRVRYQNVFHIVLAFFKCSFNALTVLLIFLTCKSFIGYFIVFDNESKIENSSRHQLKIASTFKYLQAEKKQMENQPKHKVRA